ncbi:MAG TPA: hypothetical protein VD863_11110, partial [Bradyrhizobium sp.]|nr:hypothetical protein [Bradyrhizobium sp.]
MLRAHASSLVGIVLTCLGSLAAQQIAAQPLSAGTAPAGPAAPVQDQAAGGMQISWEVRSRFRLFREERDFQIHVAADSNQSILAAEQALDLQS